MSTMAVTMPAITRSLIFIGFPPVPHAIAKKGNVPNALGKIVGAKHTAPINNNPRIRTTTKITTLTGPEPFALLFNTLPPVAIIKN